MRLLVLMSHTFSAINKFIDIYKEGLYCSNCCDHITYCDQHHRITPLLQLGNDSALPTDHQGSGIPITESFTLPLFI